MRRFLPLAAASLLLGACVSLEEAPMAGQAISKDQRVLLVAYHPPSPFIVEDDSKAETAAKIVPGLGLVVKDAQDERDRKASLDIQQYLPRWNPSELFLSTFTLQLARLGLPGKVVTWADTTVPPAARARLEKANDVNDWRDKFYEQVPGQIPARNYAPFLELDDAVVLEINLAPTLETDGEGNFTPALRSMTKLVRANTMRQLWRHENKLNEPGAARTLYDFKVKPDDLIYAWKRLMPMLGLKIVDDLREALQAANVPLRPPEPSYAAPGTASYLPSGAGWAPAAASGAPEGAATPAPAREPGPEELPPVAPFEPRVSTP